MKPACRFIGVVVTSLFLSYSKAPAQDDAELLASAQTSAAIDSMIPPDLALAASEHQQSDTSTAQLPGEDFEYDPWEDFNDKMFWFNREVLDRYVLKPIATAWDLILPNQAQRSVHNLFDNLAVLRRVVNNALQLKFGRAGTELARFGINSTIGLAGLFDVAKEGFGIEQRDEDTGQTFGVWGMGPGPYLVLPFLSPLTVRDGIGYIIDGAMTPYIYFIPWYATFAGTATDAVNERSLKLDRYERVADSTIDLYGAVRNAYLQWRAAEIRR